MMVQYVCMYRQPGKQISSRKMPTARVAIATSWYVGLYACCMHIGPDIHQNLIFVSIYQSVDLTLGLTTNHDRLSGSAGSNRAVLVLFTTERP